MYIHTYFLQKCKASISFSPKGEISLTLTDICSNGGSSEINESYEGHGEENNTFILSLEMNPKYLMILLSLSSKIFLKLYGPLPTLILEEINISVDSATAIIIITHKSKP